MKQLILCSALSLLAGASWAQDPTIQTTFLPKGATQKVGGYRPLRAVMDQDASIVKKVPEDLAEPKFGWLELNSQKWAFVLDEPAEAEARLFVDTNGDGDLTNDPTPEWTPKKQGESTMYNGTCEIRLANGENGSLGLYRFDPNDERRAQLKNVLLFYTDFGFEFSFQLDQQKFQTFVAGAPSEEGALPIDRDGNGQLSRNFEMAAIGQPFNFTGTTYVFNLVDGALVLKEASEKLPQAPLPPNLTLGQDALPFTATTMDGQEIKFPSSYTGKIVMLDFWATWCGPCIGEIPHMKEAYEKWHDQGFEILGISFDSEGEAEKVKEFLAEKECPWPQIYEGKGWETSLGIQHDVSGIPFVLLVDGDTGKILGTSRELRGPKLTEFIGEQLEAKKGTRE